MINKRNSSSALWIWLNCILPPLIIEILFTAPIVGGYFWMIFYTITKVGILSVFDLILVIYFSMAWLYSIGKYFINGSAISRSLLGWNFFITRRIFEFAIIPIFQFIKKNIKNFLITLAALVTMFLVIWIGKNVLPIFVPKIDIYINPMDTNPMVSVQVQIENISSNIKSVNFWIGENKNILSKNLDESQESNKKFSKSISKFSTSPSNTQLPSNPNEIKNLIYEFDDFLKYINSRKREFNEIRVYRSSLEEKINSLDENNKQLLKMKTEVENVCTKSKRNKQKEETDNCSFIKFQIPQIENDINNSLSLLTGIRNLINKMSELNSSNIISDKLIKLWEIELESWRKFEPKEADKWLNQETELLSNTENFIKQTNENNKSLRSKYENLPLEFNNFKEKYEQANESISKNIFTSNSNIDKNQIDINTTLNSALSDDNILVEQIKIIDETEKFIRIPFESIYLNLRNLGNNNSELSKLIEDGNKLYLRANRSDKRYGDLINPKKLSKTYRNVDTIIGETSGFKRKIEEKQKTFLEEIVALKERLKSLKSKNDRIIQKMRLFAFQRNTAIFIAILIPTSGLLGFAWLQYKTVILERNIKLESEESVADKLIPYIQNSKEIPIIRFQAIKKLYDTLYYPEQTQVDLIKKKVQILSKSSLDADVKVAAELRKVAEALELRLTEGRRVN